MKRKDKFHFLSGVQETREKLSVDKKLLGKYQVFLSSAYSVYFAPTKCIFRCNGKFNTRIDGN
jgi:hypothetical protein